MADGSKFLDLRANARALVGGIVLVVVAWVGYSLYVAQNPEVRAAGGRPATLGEALRSPQQLWNEDVVVPANASRSKTWTFASPQRLQVRVEGKAETAKGFSVCLTPAADAEKEDQRCLASFAGKAVPLVNATDTVPAGEWSLQLKNTENILNDMTVHVAVIADP